MSVASPAERASKVCQHRWVLCVPRLTFERLRPVKPIIEFGNPDALQPGKVYYCLDCHCSIYIKHHIVARCDYHMYCNCGFGYSEIQELETLMGHIERSNERRW